MYNDTQLKIFSGLSNRVLAEHIAKYLNMELTDMEIRRFSDSETFVQIPNFIRGSDCFVIQSTSTPANENIMELLIMIDALKRASAGRITAVIPYYGYARQDRKDKPRVPITSKLVANLITEAGANRVLTMDLHVDQIQGFFDIPLDHLYAAPIFINEYLKKQDYDLFVSPDVGGVARTRAIAQRMGKDIAIIDKRRYAANKSVVMNIIGKVKNKRLMIFDDILDTGGTAINAAKALLANGAIDVKYLSVHGVFSNKALERLERSPISEIVVSNTIFQREQIKKLKILDVAPIFGEAISRIHSNESISSLFI
ncbi:ribose-phosphate pyrophosphokinase [bacterium]|nr:ribose-phosphate pyrophosphokinase [bacterium]